MDAKKNLQKIDRELAKQAEKIAVARERIKDLHDERKEVALEVANLERQEEFERTQEAGRLWREANPDEHAAFMVDLKRRVQEGVIEGFLEGWWDLDEDGNMAAPAQVFKMSDFADVINPTMAHVMAKAGIFPSVGQARKNGWNTPLVEGEWSVTKKKIRIKVVA